jgi:hypothetical protein
MSNDRRDLLKEAAKLGFTAQGRNGNGHITLRNPDTGDRYPMAFSPSDWRNRRNMLAALRRLNNNHQGTRS